LEYFRAMVVNSSCRRRLNVARQEEFRTRQSVAG